MDRQIIREIIENWVVWRDAGMWDKFRTLWHDDGIMNSTWFQGSVDEFVAHGRKNGSGGGHLLGGIAVELNGNRATAQTKMTITLRVPVEDTLCDIACTGRFFDFFEKRDGRWGLVHRQPILPKKTGSIRSCPTPHPNSTESCWGNSPRAIAILRMRKRAAAWR